MKSMTRRAFFRRAAGTAVLAASYPKKTVLATERLPNIVVVVLDTVRADHLGCYGYARNTTPNIDAFAQCAMRYTRAKATAPWTLPSHASLFTGCYSFEHGTHWHRRQPGSGDGGQAGSSSAPTFPIPLDNAFLTLAEAFRALGYDTGGFSANTAFTTPRLGIAQGFDTYEVREMPGVELNSMLQPWLLARGEKPFFLFINYMDAHLPYNNLERSGVLDHPLTGDDSRDLMNRLQDHILPDTSHPILRELVRELVDCYDMGVANADHAFGQLSGQLARLGLLENAIVIVTSDHGEYFGEHHLTGHCKDVYEEVLAVPLLIRHPGSSGAETSDNLVSLAHVPSLIFSALPDAVKPPPEFVKHAPGECIVIAESHYTQPGLMLEPAYRKRFDRVRFAAYAVNKKYIESSDGDHELFDLATDPEEAHSLIAGEPGTARAMQTALTEFLSKHGPDEDTIRRRDAAPAPRLTPEELEEMRALGYLD